MKSANHSQAAAAWQDYYEGRPKLIARTVEALIKRIRPVNRKLKKARFPSRHGLRLSYLGG